MQILLVSNSADLSLLDKLTMLGYEARAAPPDKALASLAGTDVILIEALKWPTEALEWIRQWRAQGVTRPIALLLDEPTPEKWEVAQAAGCDSLLARAVELDHLDSALEQLACPKPSLLLISDNPLFAQTASLTLSADFAVQWVTNGAGAAAVLAGAQERPFAVIVADLDQFGASRTFDLLAYFKRYAPASLRDTAILLYRMLGLGLRSRLLGNAPLCPVGRKLTIAYVVI